MAIATRRSRALRADALLIREFETEAERPVQGGAHRRLLPPLLRAGGRDRSELRMRFTPTTCSSPGTAATGSRSPGRHAGGGDILSSSAAVDGCAHGPRRLDAPARRERRLLRGAGASSPASCRSPPGSGWGWSARSARTPCSASSATARSTWARMARVAEPRGGLAAARRLPRDEQRVRDGNQRRARLRRSPSSTAAPPPTGLPAERVDDDDLLAVAQAASTMLTAAREERQAGRASSSSPTATRGHSVADAGLAYRTRGELERAPAPRPDLPRSRAARQRGRGRRRAR